MLYDAATASGDCMTARGGGREPEPAATARFGRPAKQTARVTDPPRAAVYDAHADWYDAYLDGPAAAHTARVAAALAAAAGPGAGLCLDIGCGTGRHGAALQDAGWTVLGADVSLGQLRHAVRRCPVVAADAARLPVATRSVDLAVATLVHTDVDDWAAVVAEAARVIRPGGRFAYVGVHPCFVGPFADRTDEVTHLHPGYLQRGRTTLGPGIGTGLRSRVGVRHRTLADLLNPIPASALTLLSVTESGPGSSPDLLTVVAASVQATTAFR